MPIERRPNPKALAPRRPPGHNNPYRPGEDPNRPEDWKTVAADHHVHVDYLIYYNFRTHNPDIVNWYLRHYVGCTKSRDGRNWAFSPGMKPGVIYIPIETLVFEEIVVPGPSGRNRLAKYIRGMEGDIEHSESKAWELRHFKLDIAEFVHIGTAVIAAEAVELSIASLALEVAGPFMTLAGTFLSLGGAVLGAVDHNKQDQTLRGLSYGVVLGANGASAEWIRSSWFMRGQYFNDVQYPRYVNQYKLAYYSGLVHGIAYGRMLNGPEAAVLMKMLSIKARRDDDDYILYWDRRGGELPLMSFIKWKQENFSAKHDALGDGQRVDYFMDCAAKFRRDFLPSPD
ncbi:hypothetical protein [Bradyrhizobium sp. RD5-C2]|uniref:hypothetical protein n=1 Tax=Bradyrhizobium sp. RD5-C2 TaxID=244562 RepID=UPI001CC59A1E|nr:hypothetical protein [Bradyrhizobium sp. RD5-C2]GIQ73961.1 hypothetical protein BraRD5C2_23990 [Bradyrhizobium sp. RD5-C2]